MKALTYAQYEALRDLLADGYDQGTLRPEDIKGDDLRVIGMRHILPALKRRGILKQTGYGMDMQLDGDAARTILAVAERSFGDRYAGY